MPGGPGVFDFKLSGSGLESMLFSLAKIAFAPSPREWDEAHAPLRSAGVNGRLFFFHSRLRRGFDVTTTATTAAGA
jgi:hypothetical protein